ITLVLVILDDLRRVLFEFGLLVGAATGDEAQQAFRLVLFYFFLELAIADRLIPGEVDTADLDLRTRADRERQFHQLGTAGDRRDLMADLGVGESFLRHQLSQRRLDPANGALVEERVETHLDVLVAQLLIDVGALDDADPLAFAIAVVDDLDPLALLHVVDDHHANGPVRERVLGLLDLEVVEEVGRPQRLEIRPHRVLDLVVVADEDAFGRLADEILNLGPVEIRVALDRWRAALAGETGLPNPDEGRRACR